MALYPGILTVDLQKLQANYALAQEQAGSPCKVAAVVKADAYGLGLEPAARALQAAGCGTFFVATPEEGIDLRDFLGKYPEIYVLGGLYPGSAAEYQAHNLFPVLNSPEEVAACGTLPCALHIDTGMNRLGLRVAKLDECEGKIPALQLVMSHFACADEPDHPMTEAQYERFERAASRFPGVSRSLCNSSGLFRDARYHYDMVRPGMALFGLNPVPEEKNPMQPVVGLKVRVLQTHTARTGESAGYGATYRFKKDAVLATAALGYADGFHRALGNCGALYWKGHILPVRGRVSMDAVTVDLSAVPEDARPGPGDYLEVIGPHQSADDLARTAGTIGYEILTSLGRRYVRIYV